MSRLMLAVSVSVFFCISCMRGNPADLILADGMVYFSHNQTVENSTIIINGNRITDILDKDTSYNSYVGQETRIVQLNKQLVLPGFIDVNINLRRAVAKMREADLLTVGNDEALQKELLRMSTKLPEGSWIIGGDWGAYEEWVLEGGAEIARWLPDYSVINAVVKDNPVFINSFDKKIYFANRKALQLTGIESSIIPGMGLDENVKPTGIIYAGSPAIELIKAKIPSQSTNILDKDTVTAILNLLITQGITEIHTQADEAIVSVLEDLQRNKRLSVRIQLFHKLMDSKLPEKDPAHLSGNKLLQRAGYYFQVDNGSGKSSGSYLSQLAEKQDKLNNEELPLVVFWNNSGDLDGELSQYLQLSSGFDFNHRLRLNENVDLGFYKNLFVEINPNDFIEHTRRNSTGKQSLKDVDVGELFNKQIPVLFGSGWPGSSRQYRNFHPAYLIYSASYFFAANDPTRITGERLNMHEILQAYTYNAVKFIGGNDRGIIKDNNIADLVVLNKNIMLKGGTAMDDYRVAMTITDGKIVYTAD